MLKTKKKKKKNKLTAARVKHQVAYKRKPIKTSVDFSTKTLKEKRAWNDFFQALKGSNCQT
jgi:hypothetical protein